MTVGDVLGTPYKLKAPLDMTLACDAMDMTGGGGFS